MTQAVKSTALFERRKQRTRYALKQKGNGRIRLSIHRSGRHIYAQLIDDVQHQTVASASSLEADVKGAVKSTSTIDAAKSVGTLIAQKALKANVKEVVFDRGGYLYHGRVKALADAAREAGLAF